jgi:hypothetical protein
MTSILVVIGDRAARGKWFPKNSLTEKFVLVSYSLFFCPASFCKKQKNIWRKNRTPEGLAFIFLPDIFLLCLAFVFRVVDKSFS